MRLSIVLAALLVLVMLCTESYSMRWCGQISSVDVDVDADARQHKLSTSWRGFDGDGASKPLRYEWALVSDASALSRQFSQQSDSRCVRSEASSVAQPDVQGWQAVDANVESLDGVHLPPPRAMQGSDKHGSMRVVVRAVFDDGETVMARSEGVQVHALRAEPVGGTCQSDLCRLLNMPIGDILDERFGAVVSQFNFVPGEPLDDGDDDDGLTGGALAGVIVASIFFIALLLIILLLCFIVGPKSTKFSSDGTAAVGEEERTGPRGAIKTQDQDTSVVIQYPDTGLDLDQNIEMTPVADNATTQDGVRPQLSGILDAKTPSDRDYRTGGA